MPGYNLRLQDGVVIQDRLKCFHCQLIMKDPVQTRETGLLYCRECFDEVLLRNPDSLQPGDKDAWSDNAVKNEIARIPVLCLYHEVGCDWRGLFKEYFEHVSSCQCRTDGYKETYSNTVEANSEAIPVSLSGPAPTERMMIGIGVQQRSRSVESVVPSVQHYQESQPSPPLDQAHLNTHIQQALDTLQSMVISNRRDEEITTLNMQESISMLQTSLANIQCDFDNMKEEIVELKTLAVSSNAFCSGKLTWRISNVRRRLEEAQLGRKIKMFSQPFYTKPDGYKMCLVAYLNGRGVGEGTHLSVFFAVMKGEYDPILQWPFELRINLTLVDQDKKDDVIRSFNPAGQDNPFSGPTAGHEVSSISGFAKFAPLSILSNPKYVKDDVMFIKATVDVDAYSTILI